MKIAFMTDIHGNLEALKAVLADIKKEACDEIYSLGDAIAIGPCPKEVLDLLLEEQVKLLMGNHEQYYLMDDERLNESIANQGEIIHQKWVQDTLGDDYQPLIKNLPWTIVKHFGDLTVHLLHYPREDEWFKSFVRNPSVEDLYDLFESERNELYIFGHHHPKHDLLDIERNIRYINPGALGCTKDDKAPYVIVEFEKTQYRVTFKSVPYDRTKTLQLLDERAVPEKTIIKEIFFGEHKE